MSSLHEEEYDFFIKTNNFQTMGVVAKKADLVAKRLIKEFWNSLKIALSNKLKEELGSGWIVDYSNKFDDRYCKLQAYHESWMENAKDRVVAVAFENLHSGQHPFIGILVNKNSTNYNHSDIRAELHSTGELNSNRTDKNDWWFTMRSLDINFSTYEDFAEILPTERATLVDNLINEVIENAKIIDKYIVDILGRCRK